MTTKKEETTTLRQRGGSKKDERPPPAAVGESSTTEYVPGPDPNKKYKKRKDIPSVAYLLKHGDPETAHIPATWAQIIGYPLALAIVFAISLLIFHHAPHSKSTRKPFKLPQQGGGTGGAQQQQQQGQVPLQNTIPHVVEDNVEPIINHNHDKEEKSEEVAEE